MDRLQNIETFVRVAEAKSFAEAARQLRIARSAVTTRIQQLEDYIGTPLFYRSTRVVRLTEAGESYLAECSALVARANDLVDHMRDNRASISGTLKIHVAIGLAVRHLAPVLRQFHQAYPDIHIQIHVSDEKVDPVQLGVDCAFQVFRTDASGWVSKPLFPVRRVFCATPEYLHVHGTPTDPEQLKKHRTAFYSGYRTRDKWTFVCGENRTTLVLEPALLANSVHLLHDYALEGVCVACLPTWVAAPSILDGKLQVVLDDYTVPSLWLHAVFSPSSRNALKLRLFLEMLVSHFAGEAPLERELVSAGFIKASSNY